MGLERCRDVRHSGSPSPRWEAVLFPPPDSGERASAFSERNICFNKETGKGLLWRIQSASVQKRWWWMAWKRLYWVAATFLNSNLSHWVAVVICSVFFPDFKSLLFLSPHCSRCWRGWLDRWSYSPYLNSPRVFPPLFCHQCCKFEAGVAVTDGLMTGLCESFNPFMKLSRGVGGWKHVILRRLPIWLL